MKPDFKPRFQRAEAQIAALACMDDAVQTQRIMTVFFDEQGGIQGTLDRIADEAAQQDEEFDSQDEREAEERALQQDFSKFVRITDQSAQA